MSALKVISRKKRRWGLTLLEVLISLSLICTVMVSFAAVYPASFRLTRKTSMSNQAASYAASVADEIRAKGFFNHADSSVLYSNSSGHFIEDFMADRYDPNSCQPLSVDRMVSMRFPKVAIPEPYTLVYNNGSSTGIVVSNSQDKRFYSISVTVYWKETDAKGNLQNRSTTIVTAKTKAVSDATDD